MPHYLISGLLPDNFDPSAMSEEMVRDIDALACARKAVVACRMPVEVRGIFYVPRPEAQAQKGDSQ